MSKQQSTSIESAVKRFHDIMQRRNPAYYRYTAKPKFNKVKNILNKVSKETGISSNTICLIVGIV